MLNVKDTIKNVFGVIVADRCCSDAEAEETEAKCAAIIEYVEALEKFARGVHEEAALLAKLIDTEYKGAGDE